MISPLDLTEKRAIMYELPAGIGFPSVDRIVTDSIHLSAMPEYCIRYRLILSNTVRQRFCRGAFSQKTDAERPGLKWANHVYTPDDLRGGNKQRSRLADRAQAYHL